MRVGPSDASDDIERAADAEPPNRPDPTTATDKSDGSEGSDATDAVAAGSAPGPQIEPQPFDRRHIYLLIAPIITLVIINNLGNFLFAKLSTENPLLLIAMTPPNRNLILASHQVPFAAYFVVGFLRLLAPDYFFYTLGSHYGDRAIRWMERRTATVGSLMRQLEQLFGRFGHAFVLIMPNNPVCLIAGAARMDKRVFWALNVIGTAGRMILMFWIGQIFQDQIDVILGWITDHRLLVFVVTGGLVVATSLREFTSGTSEIQQLLELEEELEDLTDD